MTSLELLLLCQGVERHEKNAAEKLARAVREYLRAIGGFQAVVPLDEALPPAHGTVVSGVGVDNAAHRRRSHSRGTAGHGETLQVACVGDRARSPREDGRP